MNAKWETSTLPQDEGKYVVLTKVALMVDSKTGSHSYGYEPDVAIFSGGSWDMPVYAWLDYNAASVRAEPWMPEDCTIVETGDLPF